MTSCVEIAWLLTGVIILSFYFCEETSFFSIFGVSAFCLSSFSYLRDGEVRRNGPQGREDFALALGSDYRT